MTSLLYYLSLSLSVQLKPCLLHGPLLNYSSPHWFLLPNYNPDPACLRCGLQFPVELGWANTAHVTVSPSWARGVPSGFSLCVSLQILESEGGSCWTPTFLPFLSLSYTCFPYGWATDTWGTDLLFPSGASSPCTILESHFSPHTCWQR